MTKVPQSAGAAITTFAQRLAELDGTANFVAHAVEVLGRVMGCSDAVILEPGSAAAHDVPAEARPSTSSTPATSDLTVSLSIGGRSFGGVILRRPHDSPWDQVDSVVATHLAGQIAAALERDEARAEMEKAVAQVRQAQEQLAEYARDIRATYMNERQRANELADALDELHKTYLATVKGMAAAVEAKDEYTAGHLVRVTSYGMRMVSIVLGQDVVEDQYHYGFLLHDVGKLGVPDGILKKPGALAEVEWEIMRSHCEIGYRILKDVPFLQAAREIVYAHHERWDGQGYPRGLAGDDIPLGAKVFTVADSFDAMTSDRPYRRALDVEVALEQIRLGRGSQFWPEAVDAFLSIPRGELVTLSQTSDVLLQSPSTVAADGA